MRSRKGARIGFVADERRINVGLTRAQTSLLLVGNAAALSKDPQWSTFIGMAETMKYAGGRGYYLPDLHQLFNAFVDKMLH